MANWETGVSEASTISTINKINEFKNERSLNRSKRTESGVFQRAYQGDVIGIDATKVGIMREAIRKYVDEIQTKIDEIQSDLDTNLAFRGESIQNAIKDYLTTVEEYAKSLTSYLLTFSDKLKEVEEAWTSYVNSMGETITTAKNKFGSTEKYVESK